MSIKRMLASAALILPIAFTMIPSQADAQVRGQFRRPVPVRTIRRPARVRVYTPVQARRRIVVPGRWVQTNRGRRWIPARYIYR